MMISDGDKPGTNHYGWVIVLTGVAVLFACLGLGRFALGMLLPSMGTTLGLSYSQMGFISTANFVGYMVAVALAGLIAERFGYRSAIVSALLVVACSMLLISRCHSFVPIMILYCLTGLGSGVANVSLIGLIGFWFAQSIRGRAAGGMITGNGLAILFAGIYVPFVNANMGAEGWRMGWWTMGLIVIAVAGLAATFLRNTPEEKGLSPMGRSDAPQPPVNKEPHLNDHRGRWKTMVHLGMIYLCFGATYVVYATFIVTMLVNEKGYAEDAAGFFWAMVGALSIFSGPLYGWISDKWGHKIAMMAVFAQFTCAYALVALGLSAPWLYLSIGLYGLAAWSVPTIMAAAVGSYMGPAQAAKAFGFVTLFFSMGQITGPAVAGLLADAWGTFQLAFWMCTVLTSAAVGLALFLTSPPSISH